MFKMVAHVQNDLAIWTLWIFLWIFLQRKSNLKKKQPQRYWCKFTGVTGERERLTNSAAITTWKAWTSYTTRSHKCYCRNNYYMSMKNLKANSLGAPKCKIRKNLPALPSSHGLLTVALHSIAYFSALQCSLELLLVTSSNKSSGLVSEYQLALQIRRRRAVETARKPSPPLCLGISTNIFVCVTEGLGIK